MSRAREIVGETRENLKENLGALAQKNANLFTGFMALAVLIVGMGLVNGRNTWLVSAITIGVVFLLIFLLLNARVFIKATLAFITALLTSNLALQGGFVVDPKGTSGLVWLTAQMFLFFALITASYLVLGERSRWTSAILGLIAAPVIASILAQWAPLSYSIWISVVVGLGIFFAYYRGFSRLREHKDLMPEQLDDEKIYSAIMGQESDEWEVRKIAKRKAPSSYLVWNEEYAFLLLPVKLSAKFGFSTGRRGGKLVHRGASINPWLLRLVHRNVPLWRTRNAPIMAVLLDYDNKNGSKPEAIGVARPDTSRKIPVGIYPSKSLLGGKAKPGLLDDLVKQYSSYCEKLDEKHKIAMSEIGMTEEADYLSPNQ